MSSSSTLDFYQPFVVSAISVLREAAGIRLTKKAVYTQYGKISTGGTSVSIKISGSVSGDIVCDFSRDFTMRISSKMIANNQILTVTPQEYRILLESTLQELANMICAQVMSAVQGLYTDIQISPPKILLGKGYKLFEQADKIIVIDLSSPFGGFSINLNLKA